MLRLSGGFMTIVARNRFFMGGIIFASISLCLAAAGGYFAFSSFQNVAEAAALRSRGVMQIIAVRLAEPSAFVPFWAILGLLAYSLISIIMIYYFFENTQAPEILFFAFFAVSNSFEFLRLLLPLKEIFNFPAVYLMTASRILLFGRYFGLFSLFAAGVYAAGLDAQKQRGVLLMLIVAALYIAISVPVDSLAWDSAFLLLSGYSVMFAMAGTGIMVVTVITFFISAYIRGSRNYITIGFGVFMALTGRNILFNSDNWITPVPGLLLLAIGTWFICTRLHRHYLWL